MCRKSCAPLRLDVKVELMLISESWRDSINSFFKDWISMKKVGPWHVNWRTRLKVKPSLYSFLIQISFCTILSPFLLQSTGCPRKKFLFKKFTQLKSNFFWDTLFYLATNSNVKNSRWKTNVIMTIARVVWIVKRGIERGLVRHESPRFDACVFHNFSILEHHVATHVRKVQVEGWMLIKTNW